MNPNRRKLSRRQAAAEQNRINREMREMVREEMADGSAAVEFIYSDPYITSLYGEPVV